LAGWFRRHTADVGSTASTGARQPIVLNLGTLRIQPRRNKHAGTPVKRTEPGQTQPIPSLSAATANTETHLAIHYGIYGIVRKSIGKFPANCHPIPSSS
jgi:hypothetical protein